jgi:hypothetical protein
VGNFGRSERPGVTGPSEEEEEEEGCAQRDKGLISESR